MEEGQRPRLRRPIKGVAPSGLRLGLLMSGSLEVPDLPLLAERMAVSRYGFTVYEAGWIHGTWYCGTKFKPSSYWGQFPGNFCNRIQVMFPTERMLHLCAGHAHIAGAVNVDLMPVPGADLRADVAALPFADGSFAVTLIDPPYSQEDSERYGVKRLLSSRDVLRESQRVLVPGGYLLWLDERYPSYRRSHWQLCGAIGIVTGPERRVRLLSIFRSKGRSPTS